MQQAYTQEDQKLLKRISGALTEISHNILLVRPSWPEGKFSIWIHGFLDLYERENAPLQKNHILEMLAEDVELFLSNNQQGLAPRWQSDRPFTPIDNELNGILLRIAAMDDIIGRPAYEKQKGNRTRH